MTPGAEREDVLARVRELCFGLPETTERLSAHAARELLMAAPGIALVDEPALNRYPMPRHATGRDEVLVGYERAKAASSV